jgi:small-conductance mechanosensitive channel
MRLFDVLFVVGVVSIVLSGVITAFVFDRGFAVSEYNPIFSDLMLSGNVWLWLFVVVLRLFVFVVVSMFVWYGLRYNERFVLRVYVLFVLVLLFDAVNDVVELLKLLIR